jgi:hypothetical protein
MIRTGPFMLLPMVKISITLSTTAGKLIAARRSTGPKAVTVRIANLESLEAGLLAGSDSQGALRFCSDHQSHSQHDQNGITHSNFAISNKSFHIILSRSRGTAESRLTPGLVDYSE